METTSLGGNRTQLYKVLLNFISLFTLNKRRGKRQRKKEGRRRDAGGVRKRGLVKGKKDFMRLFTSCKRS